MAESTEDWMKRIGSPAARDDRVRLRLAGTINAPVKGIRGLQNIVGRMSGLIKTHSLYCKCEACLPVADVLVKLPCTNPPCKNRKSKWTQQRGRSSN